MKSAVKKPKSPREASIEATDLPNPNGIDWLVYSLGKIAAGGGVAKVAKELDVSPGVIYRWLKNGVGGLRFRRVAELADRANVPIHLLLQRMGPMEGGRL